MDHLHLGLSADKLWKGLSWRLQVPVQSQAGVTKDRSPLPETPGGGRERLQLRLWVGKEGVQEPPETPSQRGTCLSAPCPSWCGGRLSGPRQEQMSGAWCPSSFLPSSFLSSPSTAGPASVCTEPDSVPRPQGASALGIKQMERQPCPQEPALTEGTCTRAEEAHSGTRRRNTGWSSDLGL